MPEREPFSLLNFATGLLTIIGFVSLVFLFPHVMLAIAIAFALIVLLCTLGWLILGIIDDHRFERDMKRKRRGKPELYTWK
jgi:UDP-N-acetylmuramyl pentapeptide phosphotransferase/UDP-N-acetylglucosamine-1-phosphate transferase